MLTYCLLYRIWKCATDGEARGDAQEVVNGEMLTNSTPSATISTVGGNVARRTRATNAILAARRQRLKRLASVDVLSGSIGAIICTAFVLSLYASPDGRPQVPKHQIAGMIFTCLLCPLVYFGYREFYLQHRVLLVLLVRLVFAYGTVHDYADTPHDSLT